MFRNILSSTHHHIVWACSTLAVRVVRRENRLLLLLLLMCLQKLFLGEERSLIWLQIFLRSGLPELLVTDGASALWLFLRLSAHDLLPLHSLLGVSYERADPLEPEVEILELRLHDHLNRFQLIYDSQSPMGHAMVVRDVKRRVWTVEMFFINHWRRGVLQAKLRGFLWEWELDFVLNLGSEIFRLDINAWLQVWRSLYPISQKSLVTSEWIEVITKLWMRLMRWKKLIFYNWFWSQGKLIIFNILFICIFGKHILSLVLNRHCIEGINRIILWTYLLIRVVLHVRWHHRLVSLPSVLNLKHILNRFHLLQGFLRLNVKYRGTSFWNKPRWGVCALVNRLENWVLMLLVLRNFFFSIFWEQIVNFNVWLTFLSHAWEVLLRVFLGDYVWLQVINDQVSDTFSAMWLRFIRWRPLILDFSEPHIREVSATDAATPFKEPLPPLSSTPIPILLEPLLLSTWRIWLLHP